MPKVTSPTDPRLLQLCSTLVGMADELEGPDAWPAHQLEVCGEYGVYEWFVNPEYGGQGWSDADIIRGYLKLSAACLTTTFVITQRMGASRRIANAAGNESLKFELLPDLISGEKFATVGISHLTTSRRHLAKPVLRVEQRASEFVLDGFSPWVTGGLKADMIILGATMDDGREVLLAVPTELPGVSMPPAAQLVGLTASQTGQVRCDSVHVDERFLLAGPAENVMKQGVGAKAGGLQTSTLAIGLSRAAIQYLGSECEKRRDLAGPYDALLEEWQRLEVDLLQAADGDVGCSVEDIRTRANSLALRATQASLAAAKGTGYVVGHPTGRWCREALFFLVWSCPQPVMTANMCELAGIMV